MGPHFFSELVHFSQIMSTDVPVWFSGMDKSIDPTDKLTRREGFDTEADADCCLCRSVDEFLASEGRYAILSSGVSRSGSHPRCAEI
jgi:hypothetical protein